MNERIKGLIERCTSISRHSYEGRGGGYDIEYFDKEKLAELIVKECADAGKQAVERAEQYGIRSVPDYVDLKIKEHFGVE
jgi:molybdate-binding protein